MIVRDSLACDGIEARRFPQARKAWPRFQFVRNVTSPEAGQVAARIVLSRVRISEVALMWFFVMGAHAGLDSAKGEGH